MRKILLLIGTTCLMVLILSYFYYINISRDNGEVPAKNNDVANKFANPIIVNNMLIGAYVSGNYIDSEVYLKSNPDLGKLVFNIWTQKGKAGEFNTYKVEKNNNITWIVTSYRTSDYTIGVITNHNLLPNSIIEENADINSVANQNRVLNILKKKSIVNVTIEIKQLLKCDFDNDGTIENFIVAVCKDTQKYKVYSLVAMFNNNKDTILSINNNNDDFSLDKIMLIADVNNDKAMEIILQKSLSGFVEWNILEFKNNKFDIRLVKKFKL